MLSRLMCSAVIVYLAGPSDLAGQRANPFVGAWERFSQVNASGVDVMTTGQPGAFVIFSADGFFSQTAIPEGRPNVDKPLADLTKDELIARYTNVEARRGTYRISGDTLTRVNVAAATPSTIGQSQIQKFRIQGDTLFLTPVAGTPGMAKFRRVRPSS